VLLKIEKLVYGGDGLSRLPADESGRGKAVFIPFVLPGEEVEAEIVEEKPGFSRARATTIPQRSPNRTDPECSYFLRCGGCHYQHTSYEQQLQIKAAILKENLRRIARLELDTELHIHASLPWNYRNRTRLKVTAKPEFALGYYEFGSHKLLPIEHCPISSPLINGAIRQLLQLGRQSVFPEKLSEIEMFSNAEDRALLLEAYCSGQADGPIEWAKGLMSSMPEVAGIGIFEQSAQSHGMAEPRRIEAIGSPDISYHTDHANLRVSAGSFFQVNRHLTNLLVTLVTANQGGNAALDLYAGVGLFAASLSRQFERVMAVEAAASSYADLEHNSPGNVKPVQATVEGFLNSTTGSERPDFIVLDPPRSGLGQNVIRGLVRLSAPRLTYVSCDPATLARDLGGLLAAGYRVQQAHLVDLFPQTFHLESVLHLVR
jgi:23S rRNA (uracil1939-C5)-methyltransferase